MMNMTFKAVVFDADGTLFDTEELTHQIWVTVGAEMGFSQPGQNYLEFVGLNRATSIAKMVDLYGPDYHQEEFMDRCVQRLHEYIEEHGVPLKPGAREILEFLHQNNIPIAMATSTHRSRTDRRLELTGMKDYFQASVTGNEVIRGKPDPEIYLKACEKLGVAPAEALAVEDSRNGILSAHAAGMPVAMVPDMIPPSEELEKLLFRRFDSLLDLRDYLATF